VIQTGRHEKKKWPIYSKELMNVSLKGGVIFFNGLLKFYNTGICLSTLLIFLEILSWIFFWKVICLIHFLRGIFSDPVLKYLDNRSQF
jgi:hypothetical protein